MNEYEHQKLMERLTHILQSKFICESDQTGQYKRDISEAENFKEAKERANNGWERVRYLERKLKDTESLNEQLLRELARRDQIKDEVKPVDNLMSLIADWFDSILDNGVLACESETVSDADAYQKDILKYAALTDKDKSLGFVDGVLGLCGEAGEAAELVKKHAFQGHVLDTEHLASELGDVLWYLAYTAHLTGHSLSDIMKMNAKKLAARYPNGKFDEDASRNRKAGDI